MKITSSSLIILGIIYIFSLPSENEAASLKLRKDIQGILGSKLNIKEPLDPGRKYWLGWELSEKEDEITFEVEAETKGYVGFGISPGGSMAGADIFIAGVLENKESFSGDYHATANTMPVLDKKEDWKLLEAEENATHTRLKFSRLLDTCDKEEDYPITKDTARVIWSIGSSDELAHHAERGTFSTNFLLPEMEFNPDAYQHFDVTINMTMPEEDTTYWCTIHKGPALTKKHHIVAFDANLNTPEALEFTHHIGLNKCTAPEGEDPDEFFGKFLGDPGNLCYLPPDKQTLPFSSCQEINLVFTKGGLRMVFPEEVGFPIGDTSGANQYYMLEVHYDNPKRLKDIKFETGFRTFMTPELRKIDAALLAVGHKTDPQLLIPPKTKDYIVAGHCSPECTSKGFPEEGVTVFNSLLHAHLSGRKLKLRQFRDGVELPWMDKDTAYDFNYQQNKPLSEYLTIKPGDQMTFECDYDSNWQENGQAIPGGLTSREEMCEAYIFYYPATDLLQCKSSLPMDEAMSDLGITKYHLMDQSGYGAVVIDEPESLRGPYVDGVSFKVNWTQEFLKEFQQQRRFGQHSFTCGNKIKVEPTARVAYPEDYKEYVPTDQCDVGNGVVGNRMASSSNYFVVVCATIIAGYLFK